MTIYNGVVDNTSMHAGALKPSFARALTRKQPGQGFPLFLLLSQMKKATVTSWKHSYWVETVRATTLVVNGEIAAGVTTLVITANTEPIVNQIYRVPATGENIMITAIASSTSVTIRRAVGNVAAGVIATGAVLTFVGNAYEEGSTRPTAQRLNQTPVENYTQIFRNTWAVSGTVQAESFWEEAGGNPIAKDKDDAALFHALAIERAILLGQKTLFTHNNKPLHTMDGIESSIRSFAPAANITIAGGTTSYTQLIAAIDPAFNWTTPQSGTSRIGFCGAQALNVINQIGRLSGQYQIVEGQSQFGLSFSSFRTPRGTVTLMEHPLMTESAVMNSWLFVLDMSVLALGYLPGRDTDHKYFGAKGELSTDNSIDATGGVYTSELTLEFTNPDSSVLIRNLTAGVAG
jgi:hypothetical protein